MSLGAGMLAALQAIHAAGLVHRDIKPSNVFLTPHGPRLLDFGLVHALRGEAAAEATPPKQRALDSGRSLTDSQLVIGTPRYMAPEQILGRAVDARTDLFAAGAVLYEALAGRPVFGGRTAVEVFTATLQDPPPPLGEKLAHLDAVLRRALAKDPAERFASAQEMADALHAAGSPPPPPPSAPRPASPPEAGEFLAGRRAELAWLDERLAAALSGAGGVVFVTGERGIGKTALVGEMLRRVRDSGGGVTVVAGRCLERHGPGEALQPFLDAMGRLFGTSRGREQAVELVKTWAPTVGVLMPAALVPDPDGTLHRQTAGATRERLIRESGDFMEAATRLYPVVMLLEDFHWADPTSVELLCHLGRRSVRQRILILCTCRASEVEAQNPALHTGMLDLLTAGQGRELALGPLAAEEVEQWLEQRFPHNDFAAALAPVLRARAEGLPLFVRSLVELLAGRGEIEPHAGGFRLARPLAALDLAPSKDVMDLVRAHLATLAAPDRELLAVASVLGKEFSSAIARAHRRRRRARGRGALPAPLPREPRAREPRRGGPAGRNARHPLPLRPRPLPARCSTRTWSRRAAPSSIGAPASGCCVAGARTRPRVPPSWPSTSSAAATSRARPTSEHSAGEHAARRFAGAEAVEHYTCALELAARLDPRPSKPLLEVALLGRRAAAQLLLTRFDDAASDYQAMLRRARALPGSRPPSARRSAACATRTSSSSACPR